MTDRLAELGAMIYAAANTDSASTNPYRLAGAGYIHAAYQEYLTWSTANPGVNPNRLSAKGRLFGYFYDYGFTPLALFASGAQGAWYDPSDYTTLFEDSAGTIPITSPLEKPVGLMLDKSKGLVLGSELVVDSTFSTGTGWAPFNGATFSVSGGIGTITNSNYSGIGTGSIATVGKWYQVTIVRTGGTATSYRANILGTTLTLNATTTSVIVKASATTVTAFINSPTAGETILLDSYSVRELPGNHATQSVTTSRPILSARKNLLVGTATLSTQPVATTAVGYVLSFWGTGTVTLSGTSTAGPLIGTGVNDRVSLTFTPTAGTLTLTVSGSVTKAQLEMINETV